jgi:MoaA/NifB/PqqE/SkfB family radical SAM enzyme
VIADEYSPFKIVHHSEVLDQFRVGLQPNPVQIHLVPTNRCNQGCTFCAYRIPESASNQCFDAAEEMPREKLLEIITSCSMMGVKAIQITGGGEPLCHPDIKTAMGLAKAHGIELALVTNGQAMDGETIELVRDIAWVRFSVDAGTRDTYSLTRRVHARRFDDLLKTIATLAANKDTVLGVGFVVNRENFREIADACAMFRDLGADNFRISAAFTPLGMRYFDGMFEEARALAERAEALATASFRVFNLFNDRIHDLFTGTQDYDFCPMKDLVPYVGADLRVYTCCMLAYNTAGLIGSIKDQTLRELWASAEKRAMFERHTPREHCRLPCMFEGKNRFINYCIKNDALHVNFL